MTMRALNAAHIPAHRDGEALTPAAREVVRHLLTKIERLVVTLSDGDPHGSDPVVANARAELQQLLSPSAPRGVWRFQPGWQSELATCLAEDRAYLDGTAARTAPSLTREERRALKDSLSWRHVFPVIPVKLGPAPTVLQLNRLASAAAALGHAPAAWLPALEVALDPLVRAGLAPGWMLLAVDVEELPSAGLLDVRAGAAADAGAWEWTRTTPRASGLVVRLRAAPAEAGRPALVAWFWLAAEEVERTFLARLFADATPTMRDAWTAFTSAEARGGGVLADAAATLVEAARERRQPTYEEAIRAPAAAGIAALAAHHAAIKSSSKKIRTNVRAALLDLVRAGPWELVRRHLMDLARAVPGDEAWDRKILQAAAGCLADKSGIEPSDVRFLFSAAEALRVDGGPRREVLEAFLALAPGERLPAAIQDDVRHAFQTDPRAPSASDLKRLTALAVGFFGATPPDARAAWTRSAAPLCALAFRLGGKSADVASLLAQTIAPELARQVPRPTAGTWQLAADHAAFLAALAGFGALVAPLTGCGWDVRALAWLEVPLPTLIQGDPPCRLPASYWPLVTAWLTRTAPSPRALAAYREDAAGWALGAYLEAAVAQHAAERPEAPASTPDAKTDAAASAPSDAKTGSAPQAASSSSRVSTAHAHDAAEIVAAAALSLRAPQGALERACAWLRRPAPWEDAPLPAVPDPMIRALVDGVEAGAGPAAIRALFALAARTPRARDPVSRVIERVAPLLPRLDGAALRRWLVPFLENAAEETLSGLAVHAGQALLASAVRREPTGALSALLEVLPDRQDALPELVDAFLAYVPGVGSARGLADAIAALERTAPMDDRERSTRWADWFNRATRATRGDPDLARLLPTAPGTLAVRAAALVPDGTRLGAALVPRFSGFALLALTVDAIGPDAELFTELVALARQAPDLFAIRAGGPEGVTRRLLSELALRVTDHSADSPPRLIRAVDRWARALRGSLGPRPLLERSWPALPTELVVHGEAARLDELKVVLDEHGVTLDPPLSLTLGYAVLAELRQSPRENRPQIELLSLLAALLPPGRTRRIWESLTGVVPPETLPAPEMLEHFDALYHALVTLPQEGFLSAARRVIHDLNDVAPEYTTQLIAALATAEPKKKK